MQAGVIQVGAAIQNHDSLRPCKPLREVDPCLSCIDCVFCTRHVAVDKTGSYSDRVQSLGSAHHHRSGVLRRGDRRRRPIGCIVNCCSGRGIADGHRLGLREGAAAWIEGRRAYLRGVDIGFRSYTALQVAGSARNRLNGSRCRNGDWSCVYRGCHGRRAAIQGIVDRRFRRRVRHAHGEAASKGLRCRAQDRIGCQLLSAQQSIDAQLILRADIYLPIDYCRDGELDRIAGVVS